ncbi:MAG: 5'/3'-nucleotidase SurE [Clostridia bacterium]|nr:5'/3'-nucleotidase SurE [Clostridia bacterium]
MNILITNDDGIYSEGIKYLANTLKDIAKIYVVAPDRERSAIGHAITMHRPIRIQKKDLFISGVNAFSSTGTPADCIKLAIDEFLKIKPDIIISGINIGLNIGTDIIYSGTVAAAIEASVMGVPSIAISVENGIEQNFIYASRTCKKVINGLQAKRIPEEFILNINIPDINRTEIKGTKITQMGIRKYKDNYIKRKDPRGTDYYWLAGQLIEEKNNKNTDVSAIKEGYISVTPITYNLTDINMFHRLQKSDLNN